MRKHQEGYVLVYVMVAVVLLSLLGAAACSIAVNNLKAQQTSVARMKDEYAAEGEIEKFCAKIKGSEYSDTTKYNTVEAAQNAFYTALKNNFESAPLKDNWPDLNWSNAVSVSGKADTYKSSAKLTLQLESKGSAESSSKVTTTVEWTMNMELTAHFTPVLDAEGEPTDERTLTGYTYTVTVGEPKYTSYEHTTVDPTDAPEGAGENAGEPVSPEAQKMIDEFRKVTDGHVYGSVGDFEDTEELAKKAAYNQIKKQFSGFEVVWPDVVDWTVISTPESVTDDNITTTISTATPKLRLTGADGTETEIEVKLTMKMLFQKIEDSSYDGSGTHKTTTEQYACTITVGELPNAEVMQDSNAVIHVSMDENGNMTFRGEGEIWLTVNGTYKIALELDEGVREKFAKQKINGELKFVDKTGTVECDGLTIKGENPGRITLEATIDGCDITIPVCVVG